LTNHIRSTCSGADVPAICVAVASKIALCAGEVPSVAVADIESGLSDRSLYDLEERTTIDLDEKVEPRAMRSPPPPSERAAARRPLLVDPRPRPRAVRRSPSRPPNTSTVHAGTSSRVSPQLCAEIVGMSKDLDGLDHGSWGGCWVNRTRMERGHARFMVLHPGYKSP